MRKTKPKILIIHSNSELGRAYKSRLELEGFDSIFFINHDDALAHFDFCLSGVYGYGRAMRIMQKFKLAA